MITIVCEDRNGLYEYHYLENMKEAKKYYFSNQSDLDILEIRIKDDNEEYGYKSCTEEIFY